MAKVTWTYIEESFYQQFARMTNPEQHGIINRAAGDHAERHMRSGARGAADQRRFV